MPCLPCVGNRWGLNYFCAVRKGAVVIPVIYFGCIVPGSSCKARKWHWPCSGSSLHLCISGDMWHLTVLVSDRSIHWFSHVHWAQAPLFLSPALECNPTQPPLSVCVPSSGLPFTHSPLFPVSMCPILWAPSRGSASNWSPCPAHCLVFLVTGLLCNLHGPKSLVL